MKASPPKKKSQTAQQKYWKYKNIFIFLWWKKFYIFFSPNSSQIIVYGLVQEWNKSKIKILIKNNFYNLLFFYYKDIPFSKYGTGYKSKDLCMYWILSRSYLNYLYNLHLNYFYIFFRNSLTVQLSPNKLLYSTIYFGIS